MATWDNSKSEEEDSDEEQVNVTLMATTIGSEGSIEPEDKVLSESESDSNSEETSLAAQLRHQS